MDSVPCLQSSWAGTSAIPWRGCFTPLLGQQSLAGRSCVQRTRTCRFGLHRWCQVPKWFVEGILTGNSEEEREQIRPGKRGSRDMASAELYFSTAHSLRELWNMNGTNELPYPEAKGLCIWIPASVSCWSGPPAGRGCSYQLRAVFWRNVHLWTMSTPHSHQLHNGVWI